MKNINEEINRIKSLFTEERLYGNLVEKEVITEQGRKVLKLGRRMWDDAVTAMKAANKSIPDIPQATKDKFFTSLDNVKKLDDMKKMVQNREFDQMWKIMGLSKNNIDNLELVLTTHRDDLGKMVGDYPAYAYITNKHNLREDMVTLFFLNADDATRNKFLKAHYDGTVTGIDITRSSEANVNFIDKIMKNSDEVKKVIDDEAAAAKGSDSGVGEIPTSRDVTPKSDAPKTKTHTSTEEALDDVKMETQNGGNVEVDIEVDGIKIQVRKGGNGATFVSEKTGKKAAEEVGEQVTRDMSPEAKKLFFDGSWWRMFKPWFTEKWTRKVINPLTLWEKMTKVENAGRQRAWKITSRTVPTLMVLNYVTDGFIPGPANTITQIWMWLSGTDAGKKIAEMFGKDVCDALYNGSDGIVDCATVGEELQREALKNIPTAENCKVYLEQSNDEIRNSIMGDPSASIRIMIKEKYEKKYEKTISLSVLDDYMKLVTDAIYTLKSTDGELERKLNKSIDDHRDLCVKDVVEKEMRDPNYEYEEVSVIPKKKKKVDDGDNQNNQGGDNETLGGECECEDGTWGDWCCLE